ncbi:MAG: stage II sporulation protein P, partial [Clostridia bacterium]|nr:stage II sporulation protein P [Clostridia bacterium]
IKYYLEKYPSIEYIFDIHRDSLIRSDLIKLKPITLYGGEPCAQIMMIVGSSEKGASEYDWQSNLVLATAIQARLFEDAPHVARQLNLRGATYNQQYAKHGILLEIGSCGNTLEEAKNAAKAFGNALIDVLK